MKIEIEFDPAKDRGHLQKHGVPLSFARNLLAGDPLIAPDEEHSDEEERYKATGFLGEGLFVCIFTWRGQKARIISLRKATQRERQDYSNRYTRRG